MRILNVHVRQLNQAIISQAVTYPQIANRQYPISVRSIGSIVSIANRYRVQSVCYLGHYHTILHCAKMFLPITTLRYLFHNKVTHIPPARARYMHHSENLPPYISFYCYKGSNMKWMKLKLVLNYIDVLLNNPT